MRCTCPGVSWVKFDASVYVTYPYPQFRVDGIINVYLLLRVVYGRGMSSYA